VDVARTRFGADSGVILYINRQRDRPPQLMPIA
jgi:hypothetical protein